MTLLGAVSWMTFGDEDVLRATARAASELRIPEIRTAFSWADWERPGGREWYERFVGEFIGAGVKLVPCLFYTPVGKARTRPGMEEPKTSYPPERLEDYADFTREMIARYGSAFDWIQLWNESNWDVYWNWKMDPDWRIFAEMIGPAVGAARDAGKKIVLGGLSPYDADWVDAMFGYGVLQGGDALGLHAFPGTWDGEDGGRRKGRPWRGLDAEVGDARAQMRSHGSRAEIWLTETGYSTFGKGEALAARERGQIRYFDELRRCSADRAYWYCVMDQRRDTPTDNELNAALPNDEKAYHFGLLRSDGSPKPLYGYWRSLAASGHC